MKFFKLFFKMAVVAVLFTSCEKEEVSDWLLDDFGNTLINSDADGVMYATDTRIYDFSTAVTFEREEVINAWFENSVQSADAGKVKVNDFEFVPSGPLPPGVGFYYNYAPLGEIFNNGSNVRWNVAGSAAVTGFTHTDNSAFPSGGTFTLPATINVNSSYTLTHEPVSGADSIIYYMSCNIGQIHKMAAGTSTSVTFSADEMDEMCQSGGSQIVFIVMPVIVNQAVYNNKKYYFVKQLKVIGESKTQ